MGIASHDLTGDGCPEVYLTSQGDNKLQTLTEGAAGPRTTTSPSSVGVDRDTGRSRATRYLPSTAWHAEFEDVNNDGLDGPLRDQGQCRGDARLRGTRIRATCFIGQPDGIVRRGRRRRRHPELRPGAGRRPGRPQPRRAAGPGPGQLGARTSGSGGTSGRATAVQPAADGPLAAAPISARPGPNRDAIGAWIEVEDRRRDRIEREMTVGGGHAGGQLGLDPLRARRRPTTRRGAGTVAGRRGRAMDDARRRPVRRSSTAERPSPSPWTSRRDRQLEARPDDEGSAGRRSDLPDFGMPEAMPEIPAATYARAARTAARAGRRSRLRPAGRLCRPRAQRQPVVPDRLRPPLRGGRLVRRAQPASRPSWWATSATGMAGAAPAADAPASASRTSACRASRVTARRPLADDPRRRRRRSRQPGRRHRLEVVRQPDDDRSAGIHRRRAAPAGRTDRHGRERQRPAHRPGQRAAGHQRRRPARGLRVRLVPDVAAGCADSLTASARGCASTRRSASSSGTARRCPAT